jgi:hypothetical protein
MASEVPPLQGAGGLSGDVYLGLRARRSTPGSHIAGFQPYWSALERVIDQYQVSADKRSGIILTSQEAGRPALMPMFPQSNLDPSPTCA